MSVIFSNTPLRDGWSEISPGVSMPTEAFEAAPEVQWNHIDGPLLWWAGRCHWLTLVERLGIWLGWTTVELVAQKHWPQRKRFASSPSRQPEGR